MSALLVAGTTSDAGKTIVDDRAVPRVRASGRAGRAVQGAEHVATTRWSAPPATARREIGRAQWIQAVAARRRARGGDEPGAAQARRRPAQPRRGDGAAGRRARSTRGTSSAAARHLRDAAYAAFDDLASRYDAGRRARAPGSPAEINLRAGDYVNMGLARHGATARRSWSATSTAAASSPRCSARVALLDAGRPGAGRGLRGQQVPRRRRAAAPGPRPSCRALTGRRVYGVLPWHPDLWLDSEDALDLERPARLGRRTRRGCGSRSCGSRGSRNFTDVDALGLEPGVDVRLRRRPAGARRRRPRRAARHPRHARGPGLAALARPRPGGRSTTPRAGRPVLGICGGFQMLGRTDPRPGRRRGRGRRRRRRARAARRDDDLRGRQGAAAAGRARRSGRDAHGYEIHHGRITRHGGEEFLGGARAGAVLGTMWHGSLEGDDLRRALLAEVAAAAGAAYEPVRRELRRAARAAAGPPRRPRRGAPRPRRAARARARGRTGRDAGAGAGGVAMTVLLLGGTSEARELAVLLDEAGVGLRVVAGRPGRATAAAGRRGADGRLRRGRRAARVARRARRDRGRGRDAPLRGGDVGQRRRRLHRVGRAAAPAGPAGMGRRPGCGRVALGRRPRRGGHAGRVAGSAARS